MRRSSLAVLVLLAGCAGEVSGVDEPIMDDEAADEAAAEASAQALAGSSVPVIVALGDAAIDGVDDRAYTRHGKRSGAISCAA